MKTILLSGDHHCVIVDRTRGRLGCFGRRHLHLRERILTGADLTAFVFLELLLLIDERGHLP